MLVEALQYAEAHQRQFLERLSEWIRIPSISTETEHSADLRRAGRWAAAYLKEIGMDDVQVLETSGHPVVLAEKTTNQGPTLLLYGHYDVQPADPLEEWRTPPFEPTWIADRLYGRGTCDDKGQLFAALAALECYLKSSQCLPVNVRVLLEGEEEITSPNLAALIRGNRDRLQSEAVLICDQEMITPRTPVIMYGVRGNLYTEIELRGPAHDLHSGTFGGAVDNPFNVLARLLAQLQDARTRRITIPGFYDRVRQLDEQERALISQAPITNEIGLLMTGAPALAGEPGFSLAERISVRPTLEIHGFRGGFSGEGSKTVIPAWAAAKLSMRLVPDQLPAEIARLLIAYMEGLTPATVRLEVRILGSARPVVIDYHSPAIQAAAQAYRLGFDAEPVYLRGGGSLPIVSDLIEILSPSPQQPIPIVMIGFGLPDGNAHAPNENLHVPSFYNGIRTVIHYLEQFSRIS